MHSCGVHIIKVFCSHALHMYAKAANLAMLFCRKIEQVLETAFFALCLQCVHTLIRLMSISRHVLYMHLHQSYTVATRYAVICQTLMICLGQYTIDLHCDALRLDHSL